MANKRSVYLFVALGLLSLGGAVLSLVTTSLAVEQKYLGVTLGFFLALLSAARVQELRRDARAVPVRATPAATTSGTKAPLARGMAGDDGDYDEDAALAARLAALRARARPAPVTQPDREAQEDGPASAFAGLGPAPCGLSQRGDELRADIARLREGSRVRKPQSLPAAAEGAVSVAPPGFLDALGAPQPRSPVPGAPLPRPLTSPAPLGDRLQSQDGHGLEDLFPRTQLSGLEVTHVQPADADGDPFAKTQFTDFGDPEHGQFASTEYLGPTDGRK